jgi:hypothetical protein
VSGGVRGVEGSSLHELTRIVKAVAATIKVLRTTGVIDELAERFARSFVANT